MTEPTVYDVMDRLMKKIEAQDQVLEDLRAKVRTLEEAWGAKMQIHAVDAPRLLNILERLKALDTKSSGAGTQAPLVLTNPAATPAPIQPPVTNPAPAPTPTQPVVAQP